MRRQAMNDDKITRVPLHDVRQNEANPRTITPENLKKLVRSILEFPKMLQVRPVITDETGLILGGNMRHKALASIAELSEDEIMAEIGTLRSVQRKVRGEQEQLADFWKKWLKSPYLYAIRETELSEDDKREFVIKDNVHAGQWDYDMLRNFDQEDLQEWCVTPWSGTFPFEGMDGGTASDGNTDAVEADKRERIIIIFERERRTEVEQVLGLPQPSKAVYNISELLNHSDHENSI